MIEEGNAVVVVTGDGNDLDEPVPEIQRGDAVGPSFEIPELPNFLSLRADHPSPGIGKRTITTPVVQMAVRMGHGEIGESHASFGQLLTHNFDEKDTTLRATVHQEGPL